MMNDKDDFGNDSDMRNSQDARKMISSTRSKFEMVNSSLS